MIGLFVGAILGALAGNVYARVRLGRLRRRLRQLLGVPPWSDARLLREVERLKQQAQAVLSRKEGEVVDLGWAICDAIDQDGGLPLERQTLRATAALRAWLEVYAPRPPLTTGPMGPPAQA